MRFRHLIEC